MLRSFMTAAVAVSALASGPAMAQVQVGAGDHYRQAPPFPSQRDGQLWMRKITVIDPQTGARAQLNVLSNDPVPNPGNVPHAQAAGRDVAGRVGQGDAYANAPPFPSQRDETFLVRTYTLIDPITGAAQTVRVLSNEPVPNPGNVPNAEAAGPARR